MRRSYGGWLLEQGYSDRTIVAQLHRVDRVESHYGDLDEHFGRDGLRSLIGLMTYSTEDARRRRPNPTKIPIQGDIRSNLAAYKSSVVWYRRFCESDLGGRMTAEAGSELFEPSSSTAAYAKEPADLIRTGARRRSPRSVPPPPPGARTLMDFNLNGRTALERIIASSQYQTIAQAVASLTLFSHPRTVEQTGGRAIFPSVRNPQERGATDIVSGRRVLLDDNKSPKDAFLWANGLSRRGLDTQFNHVYPTSRDPDAYTALPNICVTPAFIAKLTDTSEDVRVLLRYRSYELYGWTPAGYSPPERPEGYGDLEWAAPLPPVQDVRAAVTAAMARKPKDRTVMAARELGWLFGDADGTVGGEAMR